LLRSVFGFFGHEILILFLLWRLRLRILFGLFKWRHLIFGLFLLLCLFLLGLSLLFTLQLAFSLLGRGLDLLFLPLLSLGGPDRL